MPQFNSFVLGRMKRKYLKTDLWLLEYVREKHLRFQNMKKGIIYISKEKAEAELFVR